MFLISIHWMSFTAAAPSPTSVSCKHQEWLQTCSLGYNPPPVENYWSRTRFLVSVSFISSWRSSSVSKIPPHHPVREWLLFTSQRRKDRLRELLGLAQGCTAGTRPSGGMQGISCFLEWSVAPFKCLLFRKAHSAFLSLGRFPRPHSPKFAAPSHHSCSLHRASLPPAHVCADLILVCPILWSVGPIDQ